MQRWPVETIYIVVISLFPSLYLYQEVMQELLRDEVIQQTRLMPVEDSWNNPSPSQLIISGQDKAQPIQVQGPLSSSPPLE